ELLNGIGLLAGAVVDHGPVACDAGTSDGDGLGAEIQEIRGQRAAEIESAAGRDGHAAGGSKGRALNDDSARADGHRAGEPAVVAGKRQRAGALFDERARPAEAAEGNGTGTVDSQRAVVGDGPGAEGTGAAAVPEHHVA